MARRPPARTDRLLLLEAVLVLLLTALAVYLFIIPAGDAEFFPRWWVGFVLAILFFTIVLIETFRRRVRGRDEMRRALDEAGVDRDPDHPRAPPT